MKKIISLIAAICLSVLAASAQNNHSISTTILGLEYSYEGFVSDNWSLIGRAGFVPVGFNFSSAGGSTSFEGVAGESACHLKVEDITTITPVSFQ